VDQSFLQITGHQAPLSADLDRRERYTLRDGLPIGTNLTALTNFLIDLHRKPLPPRNRSFPLSQPTYLLMSKMICCLRLMTVFLSVPMILLPSTNFLFHLSRINDQFRLR
jgi:hypothetical protein